MTAYNSSTPVPTSGQVEVDSTGQANGVLRRIQVRLPVRHSVSAHWYPVMPFKVMIQYVNDSLSRPTYYANAGDVIDPQTDNTQPNDNAMCDNALPSSGTP